MKHYVIFGLLQFLLTVTAEKFPTQEVITAAVTKDSVSSLPTFFSDELLYNDELYTAIVRVDKQQNDDYQMSVQMHLKKGSYFVSPNTKRDLKGRFMIVLSDVDHLRRSGTILESPLSVEEYDPHPFVNGPVNWVRRTTNYKQSFTLLSTKDFQVNGYLQFTIEPRCSLEKIPFILSYTNGKLVVLADRC